VLYVYSWPIAICSARTAGLRVQLNAWVTRDMGSKLNTEGLGRYHSLPAIFPIVIEGSKLHTYYTTGTFPRSSHLTLGSQKGHCYCPEPTPLLQCRWMMKSTAAKPQSQTCIHTRTLPTTPHHQQGEWAPRDNLATPQEQWKMLYLILWLHITCSLWTVPVNKTSWLSEHVDTITTPPTNCVNFSGTLPCARRHVW